MLACCCLGAAWRLRWLQPQGCHASRPGCPAAAPGPACPLSLPPGAPLTGCPAGPAARLWAGPRGPAVRVPGHAAGRGAAALGVRRAGRHRADALPLPGGAGRAPRCGAAGPLVGAPRASPQARWLSGAACSLTLSPCDALLAATHPRAAACQEEQDAVEHAAGLARWDRLLTPLMPPRAAAACAGGGGRGRVRGGAGLRPLLLPAPPRAGGAVPVRRLGPGPGEGAEKMPPRPRARASPCAGPAGACLQQAGGPAGQPPLQHAARIRAPPSPAHPLHLMPCPCHARRPPSCWRA